MPAKKKELSAQDQERFQKAIGDLQGEGLATVTNEDPDFTYYLAAKDVEHPHSVDRMKELGLKVVNRENNSGEMMPRGVIKNAEDGAIQTRDMVLMRFPKDVAEYRRQFIVNEALGRAQAYQDELGDAVAAAEGAEGEGNNGRKIFIMG